jgi:small nuclear ribonucleoprotein (snRNP)-like protein
VIPSTVTGLVVFLAGVGPGYLYVRVAERWRPYRERTTVREAAEIVVSGSLATLVGVVVALVVTRLTGVLPDREAFVHDAGRYLVFHPARVGLLLLIVLLVSYGLAYALARYSPGRGAEVFPDSGWYGAFERNLPEGHGIVATVELRDGRALAGVVRAFTAEPTPVDDRELMLMASFGGPMMARTPAGVVTAVPDQLVLLRGDEIRYISATYHPLTSGSAPAG